MPDFAQRFSLEATRPNAGEIAALAEVLPPGTPVYFSAVPTITPAELIADAGLLRKSGLEPRGVFAPPPTSPVCSPACAVKPTCVGCW